MRSRSLLTLVLALVAPILLVDVAQAYYTPGLGRFVNRDPIEEPGAMLIREGMQTGQFPRDRVAPTIPDSAEVFDGRSGAIVDIHLYAIVWNGVPNWIDPIGLCTCTVQVRASSKSGSSPGLHMYVYFKREGCGDDFTGAAHWGPCGFIGMCPKGSIDGKPYPPQSGNPG